MWQGGGVFIGGGQVSFTGSQIYNNRAEVRLALHPCVGEHQVVVKAETRIGSGTSDALWQRERLSMSSSLRIASSTARG